MEPYNSSSDSDEKLQVKTEPREEDIKDYAEDTMNELLAIYGYEKVDEGVTRELHLHHFSDKEGEEAKRSHDDITIKQEVDEDMKRPSSNHQFSGPSSPVDDHMNNSGVAASTCTSTECSDGENPSSEYEIVCAWCQHFGFKRYTLNTATESKAFCSEKCFAACRRAYFKRSKMCYWCRHIRHTKEYIDFQDGERKLQFCSEKCLNQYKMDVFCHETHVLGSPGLSSVESSSVVDPAGSEQGGTGAVNSSDETERAEGSMMLSVAADSSTQPRMVGNGVQPAAPTHGQDKQMPVALIQTKSKQHSNRTVIGVQHVAIAPKVSPASQRPLKGTQSGSPAASVTPPNAFSNRVSPSNPPGQVFGLQTIIQPGIGNSQLVARAPVVVRGTHWPPVVRQIPGYVIPRQQQPLPVTQSPQLVLPVAAPANPQPFTPAASDNSVFLQKTSDVKSQEGHQTSTSRSNHILPPVTVMVPQPIFIPVPYPVPIPIPVPAETFHAMRASLAGSSPNNTSSSTYTSESERNMGGTSSTLTPVNTSNSLDLRNVRYPHAVFHESLLHKQTEPDLISADTQNIVGKQYQGRLQQRDHANYPQTNDPTSGTDRRHKMWQPLYKYKTLQRSASMDLSLARPPEETTSKSVHRASRMERDPDGVSRSSSNISAHQEGSLRPDVATHLSGESSAKVREALRCHLTKRLSQSALNLTEVGRISNLQDDLRRCQSLSRLRYTDPNHMEKLPELADGCSSPSYCSSTSSTQRSCKNPPEKEDGEEDGQPSPHQGDPQVLALNSDEDTKEPDSKRKCLHHV